MEQIVRHVADLMLLAARTAPKAKGQDFVVLKVLEGDELKKLAEAMVKFGEERGKDFTRDSKNVADSDALLLVGLKDAKTTGLNCGACGVDRCADLKGREGPEFFGPICAWRLLDMGIALGSAVKTASILNVDNRIMYRAGVAARWAGMIDADIVCGIPLSASGKSIYFDRG
mgnify:FL=1